MKLFVGLDTATIAFLDRKYLQEFGATIDESDMHELHGTYEVTVCEHDDIVEKRIFRWHRQQVYIGDPCYLFEDSDLWKTFCGYHFVYRSKTTLCDPRFICTGADGNFTVTLEKLSEKPW